MIILRQFFKWIARHRLLTVLAISSMIGSVVFARTWIKRSEGEVSAPLQRGSIVQSVYGIGTVTVNRSFQIKPGVVDRIAGLNVREGDSVKKGQRLLSFEHMAWSAPFDGTVTYLPYKIGETVFPQNIVLTLVDLMDRYLVVSLEQQGALKVRRGQKVKMSFDSIRGESFDGEVHSVYSNEMGFLARIDVAKLPLQVLPGMTADVAIETLAKTDVLTVPAAAVERGFVWVKRDYHMPAKVAVKIGIVDRAQAEILEGDLKEGDRVLLRGKLQ